MDIDHTYEAIVIGTSAGGLSALTALLSILPSYYSLPIIIVQHRSKDHQNLLEEVLQSKCLIKIQQAEEKESILAGVVYIAPPNYHLLIERDYTFSLTSDEPVNYSRPSIDVLFESAALVYANKLIGIILTGTNRDGSEGMSVIKQYAGLTIAQDPKEAEFPAMPLAAIQAHVIEQVWQLAEIQKFLINIHADNEKR
ncbi:MAG: CheB methylesterase [Chitinophagaceae bacterium]|nr:CheB methylesterase [Chitinophagaceae bacterium]